uniref:DUF4371 domain-containing protein n=1 Tax=Latimeria chalumnae TaxID=7897 RepID=H3AI43_LATCH
QKKYRVEWEKMDEMKGWLKKSKINEDSAYCSIACRTELQPQLNDLRKHAVISKHKSAMVCIAPGPSQQRLEDSRFIIKKESVKVAELVIACHIACHSSIRIVDRMVDLMKTKMPGEITSDLQIHRTKCTALIKNVVIGPCFAEELSKDIGNSKFSLVVDESTDVSVSKYICVCVYYSNSLQKIITGFLGLVPVISTTADDVVSALNSHLKKMNINIQSCIGIGTDGASNMYGSNHSLFTKVKEKCPNLVLFKCVCHSVHLCVCKAIKEIPSCIDFLVRETHSWLKVSTTRHEAYCDGKTPVAFVQPSLTRWLSCSAAIARILDSWIEIRTHFQIAGSREHCYMARTLSEMYGDEMNRLYLLYLKPVLSEFQHMNLLFQQTEADYFSLLKELKAFAFSLLKRILHPLHVKLDVNLDFVSIYLPLDKVDFGFEFLSNLDFDSKATLKERCLNFLRVAVAEVLKRFPPALSVLHKIKHLSTALCLNQISHTSFQDLPLQLCFAQCNLSELENQWHNLVLVDWTTTIGPIPTDAATFWSKVKDYKDLLSRHPFAEILQYALNILPLPISNVVVERVFSIMNLVKCKIQNKMMADLLNAILTIRVSLNNCGICCKSFTPTREMIVQFKTDMYDFKQKNSNGRGTSNSAVAEDNSDDAE